VPLYSVVPSVTVMSAMLGDCRVQIAAANVLDSALMSRSMMGTVTDCGVDRELRHSTIVTKPVCPYHPCRLAQSLAPISHGRQVAKRGGTGIILSQGQISQCQSRSGGNGNSSVSPAHSCSPMGRDAVACPFDARPSLAGP